MATKKTSVTPQKSKPNILDTQSFIIAKCRSERLWSRMTFEVTLMTTRMNWLVTSQAFLFATLFLGLNRIEDGISFSETLVLGIPIIGIAICIITLIYVRAATTIVCACRDELTTIRLRYPLELLDDVDTQILPIAQRKRAISASVFLVYLFMAFWAAATLVVLINMWPISARLLTPAPLVLPIEETLDATPAPPPDPTILSSSTDENILPPARDEMNEGEPE